MARSGHRLWLPALLAAASAIAWRGTSPAPMHLALLKSMPARDTVLASGPQRVQLWFSEAPEIKVTSIKLSDSVGKAVELGAVSVSPTAKNSVFAPLKAVPGPGAYTVTWRTMSDNGHAVRGEFGFRIAPQP